MPGEREYSFGSLRLDAEEKVLRRHGQPLALAPKDFDLLLMLVENRGHVVSREKIFATIWPRAVVEDGNLARHIFNLRQLLREEPGDALSIETVPKRGYRLVESAAPAAPVPALAIGRHRELAALRAAFDTTAVNGGQLVCVTGEPGIGKTLLVEQFLSQLAAQGASLIARGRCSERLSGTDAYLPILEILQNLLVADTRNSIHDLMKRFAPHWYRQAADGDEPYDATHERMKREFVAFLQEVSRSRQVALFIDDVHWADASTVDLLAYLGDRLAGSRLLLIVTYRAADLVRAGHPFRALKQHLESRCLCQEIEVDFLSQQEVAELLMRQLSPPESPDALAAIIHARTEGNPLFVSELARQLRERRALGADAGLLLELPASLRSLIDRLIEQLDETDRQLLLAGSVEGETFHSTVCAEVLGLRITDVEEQLARIERSHGIVKRLDEREFPDHSLATRYRFVHVLYQGSLYRSLPGARRAALSGETARVLETHYGARANEIASILALLYEVARDFERAVLHWQRAAHQAWRRHTHREVEVLCRRALASIEKLPASVHRTGTELDLCITLARCITVLRGFAASEVADLYARSLGLSGLIGDTRSHFRTLVGLWEYHEVRGDLGSARKLAHEALNLAEQSGDDGLKIKAYDVLADGSHYAGEFTLGRQYAERGIALYQRELHGGLADEFGGYDPGVACRSEGALSLWFLGFSEQARRLSAEGLDIARQSRGPFSIALALGYATWLEAYCQDAVRTAERAHELELFCAENGFDFFLAHADILGGWAWTQIRDPDAGIARMRRGIAAYEATGANLDRPLWLGLLADALRVRGDLDAALLTVEEGLKATESSQALFWKAELLRVRGRLLIMAAPAQKEAALGSIRAAIECAREQEAKALEARATLDLSGLI